jgi:hypothetical protein
MVEIIDKTELALRLCVSRHWIDRRLFKRATDPIPHIKFGQLVRFEWNGPDLNAWIEQHRVPASRK